MGKSGKHCPKPAPSPRKVLIVAGIAVATIASAATALIATGSPTKPAPQPAAASNDLGRTLARADRGSPRTPLAAPSPAAADATKATPKPKPQYKVLSRGSCMASYYWEGQQTASGERFNPSALTAAHKTLPLGSKVRVTNPTNGDDVIVRINDRGPYAGGRCLDLSRAAMAAIGGVGAGVLSVKYEVLRRT